MQNLLNPESRILNPIIILIRPQMGENIGAVARAMANFGLEELRIVAPRDGWPNQKAIDMASGAEHIINFTKIYADFPAAMADINIAYATTARSRDIDKPVVTVETAAREIAAPSLTLPQRERELKYAVVFGAERAGMENDDLVLCDSIINIPTSEKSRSLNLAQAAVVVCYEIFRVSTEKNNSALITQCSAPKSDMLGLFSQLEEYLDKAEYFRTDGKKPIMWQNLRNMLIKGKWSEQEIRTFRGMIRTLWEADR